MIRQLAFTTLFAAAAAPQAVSQDDKPGTLGPPLATFPEPFSSVSGVRELDDGRVLLSDQLEQAVRLLDLDGGTIRKIGRAGKGPNEYQSPGALIALPGDSSLLVDFGNMRLSVVTPGGRLLSRSNMLLPGEVFMRPRAADSEGRWYFEIGGMQLSRGGSDPSGQTAVARYDPRSQVVDTVASVPTPIVSQQRASMSTAGGAISLRGLVPFQARDVWAASSDGRVAIVHAEPYHVEWVEPEGTTITGPTIPYEPVKITRDDKEAWADRLGRASANLVVSGGGPRSGGRAVRLPRPDPDAQDWPASKPPFPRDAATVTPDGDLWVERHVPFGMSAVYDVFDSAGKLVQSVRLPDGRQLVGFGADKVYVVKIDEDGLQWLEVYRKLEP